MYYFETHFRVVAALVAREMITRFGNKPGGYIWALLDPVAHIAFMVLIFSAISRAPALGTSFALFFATGYIAYQFYHSLYGYVVSAITSNRNLLQYPIVAPIDTIMARTVLQAGTQLLVAVIVLGGIELSLSVSTQITVTYLLEASLLAGLMGVGIAMANCVFFMRSPFYEKVFSVVSRPLILLSGVFYLPDAIPHPYREYLLINPLVHVVIRFRMGFYPEYRGSSLDLIYTYIFAATAFMLGLTIFATGRRTIRGRD
jgi:capsular polysaccharide transport system permease protein